MRDDERVVLELIRLRSTLPGDGDEKWLSGENVSMGWSRWDYDHEKCEHVDLGDQGIYRAYIDCSDVFYWATADGELVTLDNLPTLKQTIADVVELWKAEPELSTEREAIENAAGILFCARARGLRPQGAMYRHLPEKMWPLFDAAGPARETDLFNPARRPADVEP